MREEALASEWVQELNVDNPSQGIRIVDFADVDPIVMGRPVHLMGLYVRMNIDITSVAAQMDQDMDGRLVWTAMNDFRLRTSAQEYLRGTMDGFDIMECTRQRVDRDITPPPDIVVADATQSIDIDIYIPTSRPQGPGPYRYDYAIPVQQLRDCGDARFLFSTNPTCRGFGGVSVAQAANSLLVEGHFACLDDMRETVWFWERFDSNNRYVKIPYLASEAGGIESLLWRTVIINDPAVGPGGNASFDLSDATEILTRINGTPLGRAQNAEQWALAEQALLRGGIAPIGHLPQGTGGPVDGLDVILHPTKYSRTKLAQGPVHVSWSQRSQDERFLGMFTGSRLNKGATAAVRSAMGAPSGRGQLADLGAFSGKPTKNDAVLDGKLFWKGMPGAIPRRKANQMALASAK